MFFYVCVCVGGGETCFFLHWTAGTFSLETKISIFKKPPQNPGEPRKKIKSLDTLRFKYWLFNRDYRDYI